MQKVHAYGRGREGIRIVKINAHSYMYMQKIQIESFLS